ncbi:bola-like protein [Phaeosphaeriaceae sp. SRC1lsM3a]|nr:bola-like protein [Stagonospora sp. SRC1lsM3a]
MAPSRALLRCISSTPSKPATATLLLRPLSRSHCTSVVGLQHSTRLTTPTSRRVRSTHLAITSTRSYSQPASSAPEPPDYLNEAELHIFHKIKQELDPVKLEVQDISGGCGSMYAIEIESPKFAGLTVIKQHKLVNQVLKEEIAKWHGVQLRTKAA